MQIKKKFITVFLLVAILLVGTACDGQTDVPEDNSNLGEDVSAIINSNEESNNTMIDVYDDTISEDNSSTQDNNSSNSSTENKSSTQESTKAEEKTTTKKSTTSEKTETQKAEKPKTTEKETTKKETTSKPAASTETKKVASNLVGTYSTYQVKGMGMTFNEETLKLVPNFANMYLKVNEDWTIEVSLGKDSSVTSKFKMNGKNLLVDEESGRVEFVVDENGFIILQNSGTTVVFKKK
jgi:cytoskeletal protein RodZ